jgi:hypothetical protein
MSRLPALYQWNEVVAKRFPQLSQPMAACLALWSLGMLLARSCSLTAVAWAWVPISREKFYTVRERLRDLYREADAKAGAQRSELDLSTCWAPWLRWVLDGWHGQQLAVALDATTLGQRFTVLAISVLYRGCAVPVAWKIVRATEPHPWEPEWQALLRQFQEVVPADWTVIVLADRGLYAKWLFTAITALGWHPLLRINLQGHFRPVGWYHWRPLRGLVTQVGQRWQGRVTAFKNAPGRLECTLLACWEEGYEEPWLVVTDLPPEAARVCWYGLRAWIEQGFKRIKRGGWQWQYTRMHDPARAERLWLAIAVATWWLLSVGGEADAAVAAETLAKVPAPVRGRRRRWRLASVFRQGCNCILAALVHQQPLPLGTGRPEAWPDGTTPTSDLAATTVHKPPGEKNLQL